MFNAEPNLVELHRQLMPAMAVLVERFEVILVEDCSRTARGISCAGWHSTTSACAAFA